MLALIIQTRCNCGLDYPDERCIQCLDFMPGKASGSAVGANSGTKKRFRRVNIASSSDDLLVHDQAFDSATAALAGGCKIFCVEGAGQRFRNTLQRQLRQFDDTESARVRKAGGVETS